VSDDRRRDKPTVKPTVRITSGISRKGREDLAPWSTVLQPLEDEEPEQRKQPHLGLRLTATAVLVLGLFTVMVGRLWSLQVLQAPTFRAAEINTSTRDVAVEPIRGLIYARGGQALVTNEVIPVVTLSQYAAHNDPAVVPRLALLLGMTVAEVQAQINDDQYSVYAPIPIAADVDMNEIVFISEHESLFPGVAVSYTAERVYPYGSLDAQLLGYLGDIDAAEYQSLKGKGYLPTDQIGQDGVEAAFQQQLRGTPGKQVLTVDPQGDVLGTVRTVAATPGSDVVLSIDVGLQAELDADLADQITKLRDDAHVPAPSGAAIVMDPQNGQIYAMSSFPTYNPSVWVGGISEQEYRQLTSPSAGEPLLNRAISGLYTPGSTFKLVSATAALDDGLITPYSEYDDTGSLSLCSSGPGCVFTDNPGDIPLGWINVSTALTVSSDVFFYTVGVNFFENQKSYGPQPIEHVAADYGLGIPTGIDLPGEAAGQVDNPALYPPGQYYAGEALEMAFGQGQTQVTPLQLANAYATFANGGTRYVPQVAAAIVSPSGAVTRIAPKVAAHVHLPASTYDAILAGLEGVVDNAQGTAYGTFKGWDFAQFQLAGKTGTATVGNLEPTGLFVAFGPEPDPQYLVAVVIPEAGYGADTAAPVAKEIFQYLLAHPVQPTVIPKNAAG
jgi:penicillin-binding protein 2